MPTRPAPARTDVQGYSTLVVYPSRAGGEGGHYFPLRSPKPPYRPYWQLNSSCTFADEPLFAPEERD